MTSDLSKLFPAREQSRRLNNRLAHWSLKGLILLRAKWIIPLHDRLSKRNFYKGPHLTARKTKSSWANWTEDHLAMTVLKGENCCARETSCRQAIMRTGCNNWGRSLTNTPISSTVCLAILSWTTAGWPRKKSRQAQSRTFTRRLTGIWSWKTCRLFKNAATT